MSFSSDINKELVRRLNAIEFKKNKMIYTRELKEEVVATLVHISRYYNNRKTNVGYFYLSLDIGVSFMAVNKLYQNLIGSKTLFYDSIVHKNLGYLMPIKQYKEWEFVEGENMTPVFDDMFECIHNYAYPYYNHMSDLNIVFDTMKSGEGIVHIARDRYLPILYYLRGDKQSGLKVIDEAIERQLHPKQPEIPHIEGASVELYVGPSYGRVDPAYLTFVENYRNLPEPNQNNSLT